MPGICRGVQERPRVRFLAGTELVGMLVEQRPQRFYVALPRPVGRPRGAAVMLRPEVRADKKPRSLEPAGVGVHVRADGQSLVVRWLVFVLARAVVYATLFIGFLLVFLPARIVAWSGMTP